MIAIIDYGAGNLTSVKNALDFLKADARIVSTPEEIAKADKIILPGVGAFGFMMNNLRERKLERPILKAINDKKPFLGICLGMQVLFEKSEETPGIKGLCVFKGKAIKFKRGKVPQIGWNKIIPSKESNNSIFKRDYVYFVNSYYVIPENKNLIAARTDYEESFVSAIQYKNITAMQFHPEKSGKDGLELLRRWLIC